MFRAVLAAALTVLALTMVVLGAPSGLPRKHRGVDPEQWNLLSKKWDANWSSGWWTQHGHVHTSTASSSAAATKTSSAIPSPTASSNTDSADVQAYLKAHNDARADHSANALTWSDDLAAAAQEWANGCEFIHSGGSLGPYGENLAAGTGTFTIPSAMALWVDEASQYDPSNPTASHFTQVVWKATTQVGCAVAQCDGIFDPKYGPASYYVCEYSPAGNVVGQFPENVQV